MFRLLCFILKYFKAIVHFCYSFNIQLSIFGMSIFQDFDRGLYRFPPCSYGTLCLASRIYLEWTFYASRNTCMIFSSKNTHAPVRHLHQRQNLRFCTFTQAWSIRNWVRVTNFVILKIQCFFLL